MNNMTYESISVLFNDTCKHSNYSTYNNRYYSSNNEYTCTKICTMLQQIIGTDVKPSAKFVSDFITYMFNGHLNNNYYCQLKCYNNNTETINNLFEILVQQTMPDKESLRYIFKHNIKNVLSVLKDKKLVLSLDTIKYIIDTNYKHHTYTNNAILIPFINKDDYNNLFDKVLDEYDNNFIIALLNVDYIPTQEQYEKIYMLNTTEITKCVETLENKHLYFYNEICLQNACKSGNIIFVKKILEKKILPSEKCFKNTLDTNNTIRQKLIELLIYYGYTITNDDVMLTIERKIIIENLDRFNIILLENQFKICIQNDFVPKNVKFENIDDDEIKLIYSILNREPLAKIKKQISISNIKYKYVMLASCIYNRHELITYLVSLGYTINSECVLQNMKAVIPYKYDSLKYVINTHISQSYDDDGNYKQNNIQESVKQEIINTANNKLNKTTNDIEDETNNNETNDDLESKKEDDNTNSNIIIFENIVVKNIRHMRKPTEKIVKFWKCGINEPVSFLGIRQQFTRYIADNKLYDEDNIIVNSKISKILGLDKGKCFSSQHIDNVVSLFFV